MKSITLVAAVFSAGWLVTAAWAAPVPCEDKLAELRSATAKATLSEADMKTVHLLETKGVERCNADDDKRADAFFEDALKLLKR